MLKFTGVTAGGRLVINGTSGQGGDNKWSRHKADVLNFSETPKVQLTRQHVFVAYLNSLVILETSGSPVCIDEFSGKSGSECKIECHSSPITCFEIEEESLLLCSCSDERVFLSKWDSMLGHWDTKCISEDDGRILSCSVAFNGLVIYIALFKSDTLIVYKVVSAHPPTEPGPLILESIECFTTCEKMKELTPWSRSLFFRNVFSIIGIASGNTVSLKLWEVTTDKEQVSVKLKSHRLISCLKAISGADLLVDDNYLLVLIVGNDGASEVFHLSTDVFTLLYRFKIEESSDMLQMQDSFSTNATQPPVQVDYRVLCAKFFRVNFPNKEQSSDQAEAPKEADPGGGGDASVTFGEFETNPEEERNTLPCFTNTLVSHLCPKLLIIATTTKGIVIMDIVSSQIGVMISHSALMNDDTIIIQNAQLAVKETSKEVIVGLQPCLARTMFTRTFGIGSCAPNENKLFISLIPSETLNAKSVLRKKIKSPPRQPVTYPVLKYGKPSGQFRTSGGSQPAWARSRSRPLSKPKSRWKGPMTARSCGGEDNSGKKSGLLLVENESQCAGVLNISASGTYESDNIPFQECQKTNVPSRIAQGISVIRMAATVSGRHIALGGNLSPVMILRTQPCQTYRLFKNLGKVTNVHFNFGGNFLLVASSDCKTTVVDWKNTKEIFSFDFSTKFNEHVHSQFYFMDNFILQPEENKLALYSYSRRENGYIKLKAGEYQLIGQSITAIAAANQFYSNMVIAGLSNKSIQIFDTNAEKICAQISNVHSKPISCIRLNEAPKGQHAVALCDMFMTSSMSSFDPVKLWDIRANKCIMRISDVNQSAFISTSRPNISPCGRYIAGGFEDGSMIFYDVRKLKNRLCTIKKLGSTILDCCFDTKLPMVWSGCRNGSILNFHIT